MTDEVKTVSTDVKAEEGKLAQDVKSVVGEVKAEEAKVETALKSHILWITAIVCTLLGFVVGWLSHKL